MYCSSCGAAMPPGLSFCNRCGADLRVKENEAHRRSGPSPDTAGLGHRIRDHGWTMCGNRADGGHVAGAALPRWTHQWVCGYNAARKTPTSFN
jgi:hypothetical protein